MKRCPVCGTKYANDKEFCELDRALLEDVKEETKKSEEAERVPFNKMRLVKACIYACACIAIIFVVYYAAGGGFGS